MHGERILTEPEWRAHLLEKKAEYDRIDAEYEAAMAAINKDNWLRPPDIFN